LKLFLKKEFETRLSNEIPSQGFEDINEIKIADI